MTDPERNAELIKRLRIAFRLFNGDCSDRELMAFARAVRPLTFARVSAQLSLEIFASKLAKIGRRIPEDHSEGKYRVLYQTQLSQNQLNLKRIAGLRSENERLRAEIEAKNKTP